MPILIYHDRDGQYQEHFFQDSIRIGSDPTNDLVLPAEAGVAPHHTVITRTTLNRLHILVDMAGQRTRVNGRSVVSFQVLNQRDEIQLGSCSLKMWEMRMKRLVAGDPAVGQECKTCKGVFAPEDEVILCPRCSKPTHRTCGFFMDKCPTYLCEYPMQTRIMEVLAPWVLFERYEAKERDIIEMKEDYVITLRRGGMRCPAGNRRDLVPFQPGEYLAYCPATSCRTPFHLPCWLMLQSCPRCQYDVQHLITHVFSSSGHQAEEGSIDVL
jgi:hypothetical protein